VTDSGGSVRDLARPADSGWPAIVVTDPAGVVLQWNDAAEAVYGWAEAEAVGRDVALLDIDADGNAVAAVLDATRARTPWEGQVTARHRDGSSFAAHLRTTPVTDGDGRVVAVVGLSYPVGEARFPLLAAERAARASSERSAERLRRLQRVTAELTRAMRTEDVATTVLARGTELEGAGSGALWLLDEAAGLLRFVAAVGMLPGNAARFAAIPLDADLPGAAVARTGTAIYLRSRAERDARWPGLTGVTTAMEAQAVVPLVVDGRTVGALSFGFADEREFGAGERDFLAALANVCAQAVDRARLHDAERAASGRVAFLAEAGRLLSGSLDYEVVLDRSVALLLEAFAALVAIDVVNADGRLERVAMGHVDPVKRQAMERLRHNPIRPGSHSWVVLQTGEPRLVDEISDDDLRRAMVDDELYETAREIAYGPAMIVPMTARGGTVGLMFVARPRGDEPFTSDHLALAVDLAARAGSAVDNARLFAERSNVAETLQRSLLPPRLPDVPGLELGARYRPAYAGLQVGGDFYDCYAVGDGWAFMLGDVVGTGPRAAAVTAVVRHTARAVAPYVDGPAAVALAVREAIVAGQDDEVFCTLLYGSIAAHPGGGVLLSVVGAGHPQPYVLRAGGEVERVPTTGSLLGGVPPLGIEPVEVRLAPGDALVGVTDGVLEARRARSLDAPVLSADFFDEPRLRDLLAASAGRSADAIAGAVEAAVLEFTEGRAPDDLAVLVLRAT
jgi:PAS domain S-box-containing protein